MKYLVAMVALVACGDNRSAQQAIDASTNNEQLPIDAAPDADLMPTDLFDTGLCVDRACTQIAPGNIEYTPRFPLWADTATKRRWVHVPEGTTIDTSDMNHWQFPQGFKIWKEFTRDGVRIETRIYSKIGPGNTLADWFYMAYQWNAANDDAVAVPLGVKNANGTTQDIPSVADCRACHEKLAPSRVLGFQAIQLDGATPVGIDEATAMGWLSAPPSGVSPHFPIPGSADEQAALGYLHANCGHCHNPLSGLTSTPLKMRLDVDHMATTADTDTYKTAVDVTASLPFMDGGVSYTKIVVSGDAAHSALIGRFTSTNPMFHMPEIATKITDPTALTVLQTWIENL